MMIYSLVTFDIRCQRKMTAFTIRHYRYLKTTYYVSYSKEIIYITFRCWFEIV